MKFFINNHMKTHVMKALLFIVLLITMESSAQNTVQLKQIWKKHIRGVNGDEVINGMFVQPNGTVVVTGRYSTSNFGAAVDFNYPSLNTLPQTGGFSDAYLVSYSTNGALNWLSRYNYNNNETFNDVTVRPNGIPYAVGGANTASQANNFDFANTSIVQANASTGVITANISTNGSLINRFNSIAQDVDGNIYAGGMYSGNPDFNFNRGTAVVAGNVTGHQDAVLVKHNANRAVLWAKRIGGTGYDEINRVFVKGTEIYIVGSFTGKVDFNPSTVAADTFFLQTPGASRNGFLLKLDTAGNFLNAWFLSSTAETGLTDVLVNASNEIYVSGYFSGSTDADLGTGTTTVNTAGVADGILIKLNASGNMLWNRTYGGSNDDKFLRIALNKDGDIYTCGYFNSVSVDFGFPSPNVLNNASVGNSADGFIAAYTSTGNSIFANRIGGTGNDYVSAIAFDSLYSLYVGMHFNSTSIQTEFTPGYSSTTSTGGALDAVVIKYNTVCPYANIVPESKYVCPGFNAQFTTHTSGSNLTRQWKFNGNNISNGAKYAGVNTDTLNITALSASDTGSYTYEVSRSGCPTISTAVLKAGILTGNSLTAPVQHYPMDGNVKSITGSPDPVIYFPNATTYAGNRYGGTSKSFRVNNIQASFDIPNITGARQSYAFWMYPVSGGYNLSTLIWAGGNTTNRLLAFNNNELGTVINSVFTGFGITLANTTWNHVVFVKDSARCTVYINGVKTYDNPTLFSTTSGSITVNDLFGHGSFQEATLGAYDDVRVYNTAIDIGEVITAYNQIEFQNAPKNVASCIGSNAMLYANFGDNAPLSFQWYKDGVAISNSGTYSGVTNDTLIINGGTSTQNGNYYIRATKDCFQDNSDTVRVDFANADVSNGLLSYYTFNGTLNDEINAKNMTGSVVYGGTSRFGNASSKLINANNFATSLTFPSVANDTISVAVWYYAMQSGTNKTLVGSSTGSAAHLFIDNNNQVGYRLANGTFVSSGVTISMNTWNHFVVTKLGTNQKIYHNGQLIMNVNNSFLNSIVNNSLSRMANSSTADSRSYGHFDDMFIYTREVNATEVLALMNYFNIDRNPTLARACNGSNNNIIMSAIAENLDSTKYTMQWLFNGNPIVNGTKYQGVNSDTLLVINVTAADSGSYSLRYAPNAAICANWTSKSGKVQLDGPSTMQDSLRLYLKLNNNLNDFSGRSVTITNSNTTFTTDRFGNAASAASFNGSNAYLLSSATLATSAPAITVMAWFKTNQGTGGILGSVNAGPTANPASSHALLYIGNDNKLHGKSWNGNTNSITSVNDVNDNVWHHAALVVRGNSSTQELYLDGVLIGTLPTSSSTLQPLIIVGAIFGNTTNWFSTNTGWNYFQGQIDDVRTYNRAFSVEEIARIAQNIGITESGTQNNGYCVNTLVSLTKTVNGTGLAYRWLKNGVPMSNSSGITGTDSTTLRFTSILPADTGVYQLLASRNCFALLSDTIKVNVYSAINFVSVPQNQNSCVGDSTRLIVRAAGAGLSYQWYVGNTPLSNNTKYSGATSDTLTIRSMTYTDFTTYRVKVTDQCGNSDSSNTATVFLNSPTPPTVATPLAIYAFNGDATANNTTFNGTATATSAAANRYETASSSLNFTSSSNSRVTLPTSMSISGKGNYAVSLWFKTSTTNTAQGLFGCSNVAPASTPSTFHPMLFVTSSGQLSGKVFNGNSTTLVTSAQKVDDGNWHHAVITYSQLGQFQLLFLDGVLLGQNTGAFTITTGLIPTIGATFGTNYTGHSTGWAYFNGQIDDVRIFGSSLSSPAVKEIYMRSESNPARTIVTCNSTTQVGFRSGAYGTHKGYQWRKDGNLIGNGAKFAGTSTDSLTILNYTAADSGNYSCEVWYDCLNVITSPVTVVSGTIPVVVTQPAGVSSCAGGSAAISVGATGGGLSYLWRKNSVPLSNGGNISGATTATLSIASLGVNDTAAYSCVITNNCGTTTSANAHLSLGASLTILQQPTSITACIGSNAILFVRTNDPQANYQWIKNSTNISNSNNDTLYLNGITQNDVANYVVSINSVCGTAFSNAASLSTTPLAVITSQPQNRSACVGKAVSLSLTATGSGLSYQWRKNGSNISGAIFSTFTISSFVSTDAGNYDCVVSSSCNTINSLVVSITESTPVNITSQPTSYSNLCSQSTNQITFSVTATGSISGYQWYFNGNPLTNVINVVSGATSQTLLVRHAAFGAGSYTCKVFGGCDTVTSNLGTVTYIPDPTFNIQPVSQSVCSGNDVMFVVRAQNALSYRWRMNGSQLNDGGKFSGTQTDTLRIVNINVSDLGGVNPADIDVLVTGSCINNSSSVVALSVQTSLQITGQSAAAVSGCEGDNITLFVETNITGQYQWKKNGVNISGATSDELTISAVTSTNNGSYTCDITSTCGNVTSTASVLTVNPKPLPTVTQNGNTLSTQTFDSYQWRKDGSNVTGATQQNFAASADGVYAVVVSQNGCSGTSPDFNFVFSGLNDAYNKKSVRWYPNPAVKSISFEYESYKNATISILTSEGKLVQSTEMKQSIIQLDIEAMAKGVYFILIEKDGVPVLHDKFIKN